jgi:malic enzyme
VTKILLEAGIRDIADATNTPWLTGPIVSAMRGADVFVGLSSGTVSESAVASMAPSSMVFAPADPVPEVDPAVAAKHARVVATGSARLLAKTASSAATTDGRAAGDAQRCGAIRRR